MEREGFEWALTDKYGSEGFPVEVSGLRIYQALARNYKHPCSLCKGTWADTYGKIDLSQLLEELEYLKSGVHCEARRNYGTF